MSVNLYKKSLMTQTDHGDPRGSTFRLPLDRADYLFLNMVEGSFRGGHYHPRENFHLVLKGRIWFEFVDISTGERGETVAEPMDIVNIPADVAHLLKALENSMFMEPSERLTEEYAPQRKFVKQFLKTNTDQNNELTAR
jgi:dTDP-4-dehydrorhamnose 3,5-epimerase-like enzyme